jgi:hypothetical protein
MTRREFMGAAVAAAVLELCGDFYLYHFRVGGALHLQQLSA